MKRCPGSPVSLPSRWSMSIISSASTTPTAMTPATTCSDSSPRGGTAYRYGGEEFALVFPGKGQDECLPHLEELREIVETSRFTMRRRFRPRVKPKNDKGKKSRQAITITVSIGVAERNHRHASPDQVVQAADKALYRAKEAGRNRVST